MDKERIYQVCWMQLPYSNFIRVNCKLGLRFLLSLKSTYFLKSVISTQSIHVTWQTYFLQKKGISNIMDLSIDVLKQVGQQPISASEKGINCLTESSLFYFLQLTYVKQSQTQKTVVQVFCSLFVLFTPTLAFLSQSKTSCKATFGSIC